MDLAVGSDPILEGVKDESSFSSVLMTIWQILRAFFFTIVAIVVYFIGTVYVNQVRILIRL